MNIVGVKDVVFKYFKPFKKSYTFILIQITRNYVEKKYIIS